ncbi:carbon-nitrogen hydrolase [Schizothecium vesticola]|uniref:Carbon-nitrogen hydrolase n=1 Tax=Schizothecium vesticola TaxID=314040 RepID=A0AA40F430_9PEZI|nr:carbon-nitrogen hydrolase [Schizothecium vesticola]
MPLIVRTCSPSQPFPSTRLTNPYRPQAVGQLTSTSNLLHNLSQCQTLVTKAVAAGAKALFLPEATDYIAHSPSESLSLVQPVTTSPFVLGLQAAARRARLAIHVGVHEPGASPSKVRNTALWINDRGEIEQRYQKVHLFDVDIPAGSGSAAGGVVLTESDSVEPGTAILPPFSTPVGRVGSMICFDLRFPEISLRLSRLGADILTYPSAFTIPTGQAHWEVLLRARAIETQSYVVAAAQVGRHNEKRVSYGHSMVVDPWGTVVAELGGGEDGGEPEIGVVEVDLGVVGRVRGGMKLVRRA